MLVQNLCSYVVELQGSATLIEILAIGQVSEPVPSISLRIH